MSDKEIESLGLGEEQFSVWARRKLLQALGPEPEVEAEVTPEPEPPPDGSGYFLLPPAGEPSAVGWKYEWLARDDKPSCGTLLIHRPAVGGEPVPDIAMDLIGAELETTESGRRLSYQDRSQVREIRDAGDE